MRIERLLRFGPFLHGFRDLRIHALFAWKTYIEGEHVVVPILAVGVLVHVAKVEIRLSLTLRGGQLRVLFPNGTRIHLDLRIVLSNHRKQFTRHAFQRIFDQIFCDDVRRFLVAIEQALEMCLHLPHLLMVHRDLAHDLCPLHLSVQDILLHPLPNLVMDRRILNQLVENGFVLLQNAKRLLQIGQLEIVGFYRVCDADCGCFNFRLLGVSISFGYLSSQPQFPWVGQFLRRSNPTYAKSLLVYPANGLGLPTLNCW